MPRRYVRGGEPPNAIEGVLPGGTVVYRGFRIVRDIARDNVWYIVKDQTNIGTAKTLGGAREMIDGISPRKNPRRSRTRATKQTRRTVRGRSPRYRVNRKAYALTVNNLGVRFFQGYADDIRYTRQADGKKYSHVVETDAAEIYLCEHAEYGHCILIVDPSGKTPLWK